MTRFTFIVNCSDDDTCKAVSQDMLDSGFKNLKKIENDLQGDHSVTREFSSLKRAEDAAEKIFNKYDGKIYQITIR